MSEAKSVSEGTEPAGSASAPQPRPVEPETKGTFVPLIFGGAVACALGFFGGQIEAIETRLGLGGDTALVETVDAQAETIDKQAAAIAALTERLTGVEAMEVPEVDLSGVTGSLTEQASDISTLAARLEAVEKRPMTEGLSEDAIAAYEAELQRLFSDVDTQRSALQASVDAQRAEIEELLANARSTEDAAEEQARIALARAALSQVITAVDAGTPFADALQQLQASSGTDVPPALSDVAASGVPTLAALREEFPDNARAALAASRTEEGAMDGGMAGFLQRQLGVRSVAPRAGDDPDAVLSRVEEAVRNARLDEALMEIEALPDVSKAAMADWIALAETRQSAMSAADALMTALATN